MGNSKSRSKKIGKRTEDDERLTVSSVGSRDQPFAEINEGWTGDHELQLLRRTIEQDPEIFILNNLMMSIQFFENFDEEIASIRQTLVSSWEEEFNSCLPPQKHVLVPDVLQERLARSVDFTYIGPTMIPSVEPLQPIRVYVVHDNIEVSEQNFASPYCSVNETVTYSMQLKPSKHKGYALLQRLEVNPSRRKTRASVNVIYSDGDGDSYYNGSKASKDNNSLSVDRDKKSDGSGSSNLTASSLNLNDEDSAYDERDSLNPNPTKVKKEQLRKQINGLGGARIRQTRTKIFNGTSSAESTSSGYKSSNYAIDSDSDSYAVSTVGDAAADSEGPVSSSEVPRECFQIYDPRKPRVLNNLNSKDKKISGIIHSRKYDVWYLNSSKFMDHFYKFFINELSDLMGFDADDDEEVDGPQGAIIYRDKIEPLESIIGTKDDQFAIIPCIWSPWPEIADEWLDRPRTTWPDYDVIEKVKEIGCYIIPEGYTEQNGNNSAKDLEWELTFPAAERYLETCMSYSQVRVYFMALVLQKTFIRPIDSFVGLTAGHIRHHMFWMIEELDTPSKWMDNRMGECVMTFLGKLYDSISQDDPVLQDYFIKDKNIFPAKKYLLRTQKQLKRILENPVMYFIHAMQNIKHSRSFFPKLDYATLLRILTDDILMLINPHLNSNRAVKTQSKSVESVEKIYEPAGGFWDSAKHEKDRRHVRKTVTSKNLVDAKTSYDLILEITVKCAEMEPHRLCLLLDLFIRHFIKIAECCHKYRSQSQKTVYIEHSERLCMILSKYDSYKDDAKAYLDKLHALKRRVANGKSQSDPPATPVRNSDRPIFSASLNERFQPPVESQTIVNSAPRTETRGYEVNGYKTENSNKGSHKFDTPPVHRKRVTMAVVHEVESSSASSTEAVELQPMKNSKINNKSQTVSLEDDKSSQEETTYI